jgi:hypothetical protein
VWRVCSDLSLQQYSLIHLSGVSDRVFKVFWVLPQYVRAERDGLWASLRTARNEQSCPLGA